MGEGRDKVAASCTGTGAGIAPHSGWGVVIVVMAMALVMAPKKKSGDDGIEMAAFTGSLFGPPLPQAPWSTPSAIAPCPAWQIWRP